MTPGELATLSLLDSDQGVCPDGHPCRLSNGVGDRSCSGDEYIGLALICWDITDTAIDSAARNGATDKMVSAARLLLLERDF